MARCRLGPNAAPDEGEAATVWDVIDRSGGAAPPVEDALRSAHPYAYKSGVELAQDLLDGHKRGRLDVVTMAQMLVGESTSMGGVIGRAGDVVSDVVTAATDPLQAMQELFGVKPAGR